MTFIRFTCTVYHTMSSERHHSRKFRPISPPTPLVQSLHWPAPPPIKLPPTLPYLPLQPRPQLPPLPLHQLQPLRQQLVILIPDLLARELDLPVQLPHRRVVARADARVVRLRGCHMTGTAGEGEDGRGWEGRVRGEGKETMLT